MLNKPSQEYQIIDASRYMITQEALSAIVPHPEELQARLDLIGLLSGRRPNMNELLLGFVEQEGWISMSQKKEPTLGDGMDAVSFLRSNAPSLDGFRSKQVVEIAKAESQPANESILDYLKHGLRKNK